MDRGVDQGLLSSLGAVAVAGVGVRSALGPSARSTFDAMRGGIGRLNECSFLRHPRTGEPITVALDAGLDPRALVLSRLEILAAAAASEALGARPLSPLSQGARLGVLLSMAPDRPGMDGRARRSAAQAIVGHVETLVPVDRAHCRALGTGHDGGIAALVQGVGWLNAGAVDACLVGGVESCVDLAFLDGLAVQGRLKAEDCPFGLTPGEAAAFLLLVPARPVPVGRTGCAYLASPSWAAEPHPWYSHRPSLAEGLTTAIAGVFASPPARDMRADVTYADLNGEPWRADEWSAAYIRTADNHGEPMHMRHPADCWGDVGAASAPLLACMAALEVVHPRMRSRAALVWTASDAGVGRGAVMVLGEKGAC